MPQRFTGPRCRASLEAGDEYAGTTVACSHCKKRCQLPAAPPPTPAQDDDDSDDEAEVPTTPRPWPYPLAVIPPDPHVYPPVRPVNRRSYGRRFTMVADGCGSVVAAICGALIALAWLGLIGWTVICFGAYWALSGRRRVQSNRPRRRGCSARRSYPRTSSSARLTP